MDSSNRALENACKVMDRMADKIFLVKTIKDGARAIFKQVREGNLLLGHSNIEIIASACLYLSCWEQKVPRTYHEISLASKVEKEKYSGYVIHIKKKLDLQLDPIKPADYIPRFCSQLDLPFKFATDAMHVAQKASELDIVPGRNPATIAATAIYFVSQASDSNLNKTKEQIGLIIGTSPSTIRDCYKLMRPRVTELFPSDFVFATPVQ